MNHAVDITKEGAFIVFTNEDFYQPAEIWSIATQENATPQRLTHTIKARFMEIDWINPRIVHFEGHTDRKKLTAMLYEPRAIKLGRRYPAVLYAHGGPVQGVLRQFGLYTRHRQADTVR